MQFPDHPVPIVVLTGAGISKESGLDTFRDEDGIWSKVRIEDVATPEAFRRDPERVMEFYNHRRAGLLDPAVHPNEAHKALARLQESWPEEVMVVTQNIDNLHERGGAKDVVHMHGELLKVRCEACGNISEWLEDLTIDTPCFVCGSVGTKRPHVVWFGEMPLHMDKIEWALTHCGLFVSIGTSGNVYPAAGFVSMARLRGKAYTIELNLEPSEGSSLFHECRHGQATDLVPAFVDELLMRNAA
ncbi:Sir2 family NAD+-dependent deacetylase [Hwanghaeella sp.]|uniref:Sir2 family NAD+-dependent deacetylase n=1 Tax=Hwanghaeella sp. TaxID=2605943 RepID=UPI003CCB7DE3